MDQPEGLEVRLLRLEEVAFGLERLTVRDILEQLAMHGVVHDELRARLRNHVDLRAFLIRADSHLDPERLAEHLEKAPRDFSDFGRAIRRWIEQVERA